MKNQEKFHLQPAFVLKNYPENNKVILLHKKLGKIVCFYRKNDQASRLCTASKVICSIKKERSFYKIESFDLLIIPIINSLSDLQFFHDIVFLCLRILPGNIVVNELFDFLSYLYQNLENLNSKTQHIIMLRLFLLFDILPEDLNLYQIAIKDPFAKASFDYNGIDLLISERLANLRQKFSN